MVGSHVSLTLARIGFLQRHSLHLAFGSTKRTHRMLVGKEIFSFQVAWKHHHVASPVVENCTCRRLQNDLRYSRQLFTSGSRRCEHRPGINSRHDLHSVSDVRWWPLAGLASCIAHVLSTQSGHNIGAACKIRLCVFASCTQALRSNMSRYRSNYAISRQKQQV